MSWEKPSGIAAHLGISVKSTRRLIEDGVIPITRLPSGRIIGNLEAIDKALLELGDTRRREEDATINNIMAKLT